MAERQRGMGRGLAAILSVAPREEPEELRQLPLELISANPHQPRDSFDEAALLALAESIKVRAACCSRSSSGRCRAARYELIAGERRWRAAQLAELETIPAIVRHHDDAASLELALIENMAREDLNPVEQARACAALIEELGLTREEVGRRVGRSRVAVSNLIRLLDLPDEALELIERRRPQRGPRPRAAAAPTTTTTAGGWPAPRSRTAGRCASSSSARRGRADETARLDRASAAAPQRLHPDQEAAIDQIADTLEAALGREVEVSPGRRRATAPAAASSRSRTRSSCARSGLSIR